MIVSLTHKSTHVANEAEEAALWGICSRLAEGRGEDSEAGVPMALCTPSTPRGGFICTWSFSRPASYLNRAQV